MLTGAELKRMAGSRWKTTFSAADILKVFDAQGPVRTIVSMSQFSLTWFVEQTFCNRQGKPLKLEAFQAVMLHMLWHKKFPMVLASRGAGKSFMLALYALLKAILVPGSKIVICGAGYRQAKLVFKYVEELYESSPLIKEALRQWGGPKYGSDAATLRVGRSLITAIPIGDGEKIRGLRACVDPNTIIETDRGLFRIKDTFDNPDNYRIYTGNGKNKEVPSHYVKTKPIDAYRISTLGGYEFTCSDIHRVYTKDGFKDAKDLTEADSLEFINNYEFPDKLQSYKDITIDEDLAWALGLLVSEGAVNSPHTMSIKMTEKEPLERYASIMSRYGLNVCKYTIPEHTDKRGWVAKEAYEYKICNKKFRAKLEKLGLKFAKAIEKSIPSSILASPRSIVSSFLSGLFHGDGSAFLYKDKYRDNNFGVAYYTGSRQLSIDVQILLAKLDIFCSRSERESKLSDNTQYSIRVYGKNTFDLYDTLSVPKWTDIYRESFKDGKFIAKRNFLGVKSVTKLDGKHILYDYTLPKEHSFMGNGFRQHNTCLIADEFASIPEEIFEIVLSPFTAVHANPAERAMIQRFKARLDRLGADKQILDAIDDSQGFGNQVVISGTASYKYNHFYKRYQVNRMFIDSRGDPKKLKHALEQSTMASTGKAADIEVEDIERMVKMWKHYAVYQLPYNALPEGFLDEDMIRSDRAKFPKHRFDMEYLAKFPDDSDGFIKRSQIEKATPKAPDEAPVDIELYGDPRATYVMGLDPARWNDNFGCVVLKLTDRGKETVYSTAWDSTQFSVSAKKIREICKRFNIQYIAMDSGGGGSSVIEWLYKKQDGVSNDELLWPIPDQLEKYATKDAIAAPGRKMVEMVNFSASWTAEAAHNLVAAVEQRNLLFPYKGDIDSVTSQYMRHWQEDKINDAIVEKLNQDLWGIDEWDADRMTMESKRAGQNIRYRAAMGISQHITECVNETCAIVRNVTPGGTEQFTLPKLSDQPEGLDMRRRDRFSALMLANYAAKVFQGHGHKSRNMPGTTPGYHDNRKPRTAQRVRSKGSVRW